MGATEIVQALVSPAEKLIETVSGAIGKAYEPKHIRKMADAKAYELRQISDAVRNNSDVPIVYDSTGVSIDTSNFEEIAKRASSRLAYQEITKQQNIEAVTDNAYDELSEGTVVSSEPVNPDWMFRFFNSVENISNEKIQKIWGHILAGEIKLPNTYSYRTLDRLKNMTQQEIEHFQLVSSLAVQNSQRYFLFLNDKLLNKYDVYYSHLLELEECGLITAKELSITFAVTAKQSKCIFNSEIIGLIKGTSDEIRNLRISAYVFTESGGQLIKAIQTNSNREYIIECLKLLRDGNKDLVITAHNINFIDNDEINCKKDDIMES